MYTKIIQSGERIEIFNYEKEPPIPTTKKKSRFKNPKRYNRSVQRARLNFFRLVKANVSANKRPALVTLTMREVVPIREGWKRFRLFAQRFKNQKQGRVLLVSVPEFQKRGAVHFHVLAWGLTDEEINSERATRRIAILWREGFVDIRTTDGSDKLVGYLTKYLSKGLFDSRLSGQKAYSCSRGLLRPVSLTSAVQIDEAKKQWGIGVDNFPLTEKTYYTRFMGRCDYQVYNL